MNNRLGILGGTFNPIHNGHLFAAEYLCRKLDIKQVIFVPCGVPPHKKTPLISAAHRCNMVEMAIADIPIFSLSTIETQATGKSYTIDTVTKIKEANPKSEIYFFVGADNIVEIPSWKNYLKLLKECKFTAISRPGYNNVTIPESIPKGSIRFVSAPSLNISSTNIRKLILEEQKVRDMIPEKVYEYILKNNLYHYSSVKKYHRDS